MSYMPPHKKTQYIGKPLSHIKIFQVSLCAQRNARRLRHLRAQKSSFLSECPVYSRCSHMCYLVHGLTCLERVCLRHLNTYLDNKENMAPTYLPEITVDQKHGRLFHAGRRRSRTALPHDHIPAFPVPELEKTLLLYPDTELYLSHGAKATVNINMLLCQHKEVTTSFWHQEIHLIVVFHIITVNNDASFDFITCSSV